MRKNPYYALRKLHNVWYLLPFGQSLAEGGKSMQLNDTGAFLWETVNEDMDCEALAQAMCREYGLNEEDEAQCLMDVKSFSDVLCANDMLRNGKAPAIVRSVVLEEGVGSEGPVAPKQGADSEGPVALAHKEEILLQIAGLTLCLAVPKCAVSHHFDAFVSAPVCFQEPGAGTRGSQHKIHQRIILTAAAFPKENPDTILITDPCLKVSVCHGQYYMSFPQNIFVKGLRLSFSGDEALFFCPGISGATGVGVESNANNATGASCVSETDHEILREELFQGIRVSFLYLAEQHDMVALHSASILYKEKAYLFAGPSGMGKSTHTALWNQILGVPVLNGDLNLIAQAVNGPVIHGIPWCGTSGRFDGKSHPLGGIILLERAAKSRIVPLSPDQKILLVQKRLISPCFTENQLDHLLSLTTKTTSKIYVSKLCCTKNPEAVNVIRDAIDRG